MIKRRYMRLPKVNVARTVFDTIVEGEDEFKMKIETIHVLRFLMAGDYGWL